jgi:hypothetical protein
MVEIGVGVGWAALAVVGYGFHIRHARRSGLDAFA